MENKFVRVGIGIIVTRDQKILLGKRKNSHGDGEWSLPGGHLEFNECWEDCARRELKEETGMDLIEARYVNATNDIFTKESKHYITLFMSGTAIGEPELLEPNKCDGWDWFSLDNLPSPLFTPLRNYFTKNPSLDSVTV